MYNNTIIYMFEYIYDIYAPPKGTVRANVTANEIIFEAPKCIRAPSRTVPIRDNNFKIFKIEK
jgi:hypothetical protein